MKILLNKKTIIKKYFKFLNYTYKNFSFFKKIYKKYILVETKIFFLPYTKKYEKRKFFYNLKTFNNIKQKNSFLYLYYKNEFFCFILLKVFKLILIKTKKIYIKDSLFKYILYKIYLNKRSLIYILK